jgi:hypothetical protein
MVLQDDQQEQEAAGHLPAARPTPCLEQAKARGGQEMAPDQGKALAKG